MVAAIIALITALIGYFGAKKGGASSAQAAGVAAAAGLGTYYVATETDWGKSIVADVDAAWVKLTNQDGSDVIGDDGKPVYAPPGAVVVRDEAGNLVKDSGGNWFSTATKTIGDVLKDWGASGTALVVGTGAAASGGAFSNKWLLYGGLAVGAILLLK